MPRVLCVTLETFGDTRELMLTGEAYFEVAKDPARPFIVHVGDNSVEVLGTHFNVSSYEKGKLYTTLAEGKVKVSHDGQSVILNPNEQAIIEPGISGIEIREVDAFLYTSWINGRYESGTRNSRSSLPNYPVGMMWISVSRMIV